MRDTGREVRFDFVFIARQEWKRPAFLTASRSSRDSRMIAIFSRAAALFMPIVYVDIGHCQDRSCADYPQG